MAEPQVIFSHSEHNEPAHDLAAPIAITIPGQSIGGQPIFLLKAVGGLTKLEHVAAMICAENARDFVLWEHGGEGGREAPIAAIASRAIDMAEALLAECAKRQTPKEAAGIEIAQ